MKAASLICPDVELLLVEAVRDRLYGTIEIRYESGRVVLIKKSETIKPADDRTSRSQDGENE
jgi:hypothetical protein